MEAKAPPKQEEQGLFQDSSGYCVELFRYSSFHSENELFLRSIKIWMRNSHYIAAIRENQSEEGNSHGVKTSKSIFPNCCSVSRGHHGVCMGKFESLVKLK